MEYYIRHNTDCDLVETHTKYSFDSDKEAQEYIENDRYYADGPVHWEEVTRQEYLEFEDGWHDIGSEQAGY